MEKAGNSIHAYNMPLPMFLTLEEQNPVAMELARGVDNLNCDHPALHRT
jgi:hypothetical protein